MINIIKHCDLVLLNLLKLVAQKKIKFSASLAFYLFSPTRFINFVQHEQSCKILYFSYLIQIIMHLGKFGTIRKLNQASGVRKAYCA